MKDKELSTGRRRRALALAALVLAMSPLATTAAHAQDSPRHTPQLNGWLAELPPDTQLLQLMGSGDRQALAKYAASFPAGSLGDVHVAHILRKRKDWYLLLSGPYPDEQAAAQAIALMPPEIRAQKPWPRSTGSVQALTAQLAAEDDNNKP